MASKERKQGGPRDGTTGGGQDDGAGQVNPWRQGSRQVVAVQKEGERASSSLVGLLMAPPVGGGEQGGLVERPSRPKPSGGSSSAPLSRRHTILGPDMPTEDGNWDDGQETEEMGFQQGSASQIGGIVDMEDDVYLEFDEEEECQPRGDYNFVMRGGPWIFKRNALLIKDFDESAQPSETILDSMPIWDENEFLRVGVNLAYERRLQTQITTGVKGKPWEVKVYKVKYERVMYYCSHCGFMGHWQDECEKQRSGVPSLD
ncbi:hypothetical protein ACQ4PT_054946 [Festuca glaucescens]